MSAAAGDEENMSMVLLSIEGRECEGKHALWSRRVAVQPCSPAALRYARDESRGLRMKHVWTRGVKRRAITRCGVRDGCCAGREPGRGEEKRVTDVRVHGRKAVGHF